MVQSLGPTAWQGRVSDFLDTKAEAIVTVLHARHSAGPEQVAAWLTTLRQLGSALRAETLRRRQSGDWWLSFEYELPREGGRRPDVLLVTSREALVIEVKDSDRSTPEGITQCEAYVRDLREYHGCCDGLDVRGLLFVTRGQIERTTMSGVAIGSVSRLSAELARLTDAGPTPAEVSEWMAAPYAPLPSLIVAARHIFQNEPLPNIKRVNSSNIPEALATLQGVAEQARKRQTHHLVLLTGAPGAGKTLVGLKFVHEYGQHDRAQAVFLSGNAPLVSALRHILTNKVFVQDVHAFMYEVGVKRKAAPPEEVVIFDEAQRAWDRPKVEAHYAEKKQMEHAFSEPETFVQIVGRRKEGGVLVGLIGYGQEIHSGEEAGIMQWADAVAKSDVAWTIHCPPRLRAMFPGQGVEEHSNLDLVGSVRAHAAAALPFWVESLLEGRLAEARRHANALARAGFYLYVTPDLKRAQAFLSTRYADAPQHTYGMLASSHSKNLVGYGLDTRFQSPMVVSNYGVGKWIVGTNSTPPGCRTLQQVATEFQCQGLELDGSLLAWGSDLVWVEGTWEFRGKKSRGVRGLLQLRKNSYRVLLTRSRDGMVIYCPDGPEMEETAAALIESGCTPLDTDVDAGP